jgi:hypothetical protein
MRRTLQTEEHVDSPPSVAGGRHCHRRMLRSCPTAQRRCFAWVPGVQQSAAIGSSKASLCMHAANGAYNVWALGLPQALHPPWPHWPHGWTAHFGVLV